MTEKQTEFGIEIKKVRSGKGKGLREVAESSGIGRTTISDLENGADPRLSTAIGLCRDLGVKLSTVLRRIGE